MKLLRFGIWVVVVAIAVVALRYFWAAVADPSPDAGSPAPKATIQRVVDLGSAPTEEAFSLDLLNAPQKTIRDDIDRLDMAFEQWVTNFPRAGNPVGTNAEITAALAGANPLRFSLLNSNHRAIDASGELCDRWGTPFRFHQLSGTVMEIISAGPDRDFGTEDDVSSR